MKFLYIAGWGINIAGFLLWLYGYFTTGNPSLIDWPSISPEWASAFLPNLETEIGVLLMCLACVPFIGIAMAQQSENDPQ